MKDIMLSDGDMFLKNGDIVLEDSVAQKIKIRLLWFEGEWRWNKEEGLPYFSDILVKNYDTNYIESIIREKIFEVDEVTEVKEVTLLADRKTRVATIRYTALTDYETIKEEVRIDVGIRDHG